MNKKIASLLIVVTLVVSLAAIFVLLGTASTMASAPQNVDAPDASDPPTMVNYQGTLRKDGGLYIGTGYFKFAIKSTTTGDAGTNYWAHDGTATGEPTDSISLTVTHGLFNVMLGDTSITSMTQSIPHTVFNDTYRYLRVWFSETYTGTFQALEPNQRFASVAYALRCMYAENYTESDPVFSGSPAWTITGGDIGNWNHAFNTYDTTDDAWTNSGPSDVSVTNYNVGIDVLNPNTLLHVRDNVGAGPPQLLLEQGAPAGDAYMEFFLGSSGTSFSTGYDGADGNFKTTNTNNLTGGVGSTQGDGITMLQAHPSGILDFNNQSRARASLNHPQSINPLAWTPIEFDDDFTPFGGYDQQGEFTLWTPVPTPAFFVATEEGYYQVHSRTAFEMYDPVQPNPFGYVSISIWVTTPGGVPIMYAQGNNMQMMLPTLDILFWNNAPNVSDVVWLMPGDMVDIRVWQDLDFVGPAVLTIGPSQTYVSIHKDS